MVKKALAFIFRNNNTELLCFVHPKTGWSEVVRGTIEKNEDPERAIVRELYEEAGINETEIENILFAGNTTIKINGGYDATGPLEQQTYFGFQIKLKNENRKTWIHKVVSDGIDNSHEYTFEWKKYDKYLVEKLNPFTKDFIDKKIEL